MSIERRTVTEMRASKGDKGELYIGGYAARFNVESKDLGGFREVVAPGAFTRSIKEKRDVKALFNHDANYVLGRTGNDTLTLTQDEQGLQWRCELNAAMQSHRDLHASVDRGDIHECSFAFTAPKDGQVWSERAGQDGGVPVLTRTLTDVNLFDVSAVCYPAYPGTEVAVRGEVVAPEVRSMIAEFAAKHGLAAVPVPVEQRDEEESYEEIISEVQAELNKAFPSVNSNYGNGYGKYWLIETHEDFVIVCEQTAGEADFYKISYAEVDEKWAWGDPVKMEKVWVEAEDGQRATKRVAELRSLHSLAGDHQYAADYHKQRNEEHQAAANAIKEAADRMETCSASMGSHEDEKCSCQNNMVDKRDVWDGDETDDTDVDGDDDDTRSSKAVRRAEKRTAFEAALEARAEDSKVRTKKVGDKNLPASAFAYVGDKNKTETWKLPIHDADHVRNALARLNQTEGIPADAKAGVTRKIKGAAKKFNVDAASLDERSAYMTDEEIGDVLRRAKALLLQN